jgi:hypothetical protein
MYVCMCVYVFLCYICICICVGKHACTVFKYVCMYVKYVTQHFYKYKPQNSKSFHRPNYTFPKIKHSATSSKKVLHYSNKLSVV